MEREQIILKSLTQGQERQITRGIPQGSEPRIYKELNLEEQGRPKTATSTLFQLQLQFHTSNFHFACCALGHGGFWPPWFSLSSLFCCVTPPCEGEETILILFCLVYFRFQTLVGFKCRNSSSCFDLLDLNLFLFIMEVYVGFCWILLS